MTVSKSKLSSLNLTSILSYFFFVVVVSLLFFEVLHTAAVQKSMINYCGSVILVINKMETMGNETAQCTKIRNTTVATQRTHNQHRTKEHTK